MNFYQGFVLNLISDQLGMLMETLFIGVMLTNNASKMNSIFCWGEYQMKLDSRGNLGKSLPLEV